MPSARKSSAIPGAQIDEAEKTMREIFFDYNYVEMSAGFRGSLAAYARFIVRAAHEKAKPNDQRLRGYHRLGATDAGTTSVLDDAGIQGPREGYARR